MVKKITVSIRMTERDKEILEMNAYRSGKNFSEYCRDSLMDRELANLTHERIADRLAFIKELLEDNQNSKTSHAFEFENVLVEILLLLRSRAQKSDKDMIFAELKRIGLSSWDAKGVKKD